MKPLRRQIVCNGLLTIFFGSGATCQCLAQPIRLSSIGCTLRDEDAEKLLEAASEYRLFVTGQEPIIPKSGNNNFDLALARTLAKMSQVLEVLPGFAYYDDRDGANAYATSKVRMSRADGTVLFGQRLLGRLLNNRESPEISVAAVCAHEFGHILQFKRGLHKIVDAGQRTVKRSELQADFFAGYFAGIRKLERPQFPAAVFAQTQFNFGDNMVDNPSHHGTPKERGEAISRGFEVAYRDKKSLVEAIEFSVNYVRSL